ncbi:hypothetical protein CDAR_535541 [Caerostris darwini]|uniref:Uncharacterized protein n=1 Tax=Caerostris darwini TaxID=1538125 RepID=A0AAV4QQ45_9ARAC|nr:hypothetical protein CDAR_535541 [Caerostris darwini]
MFAKIAFFCAALVAACAYAPLVNTGVSAVSNQQDAYGNYAYRYDIKDAATGSLNSKAEVGKVGSIAVAAPAVAYGAYAAPAVTAYAAPAVAAYAAPAVASYAPATAYGDIAAPILAGRVAYGGIAAPVLAGRVAYGGIAAPAIAAPLAYGGALGHGGALCFRYGGALGLGYGSGILGAGLGWGNNRIAPNTSFLY